MRRLPAEDRLENTLSGDGATPSPIILVVDDDENILRVFATCLAIEGYRVLDATTGQRAIEEVRTRNPDVILLDLGLPDADGLSLVPEIRGHTTAPIIIVSGREQESSKVRALDTGANDYLTKPFSVPELRARIRVGLRSWAYVGDSARTTACFGDCTLDLKARRLTRGGRLIHLSLIEFNLLAALARRADQVVTAGTLLREVWGSAYRTQSGYIRVYMHSVRHKIEKDPAHPKHLINESGFGYRLRTTPGPEVDVRAQGTGSSPSRRR